MRSALFWTSGFLGLLAASTPAMGQSAPNADRPIPALQFGSTASFSGFQFQQSTFGTPIGTPIAFPGIQFPGFASRYDATPGRTGAVPPPAPRIGNSFDPRFVARSEAAPRSPRGWRRSDRSDPFDTGWQSVPVRSRELLQHSRQPFGAVSPSRIIDDRRTSPRNAPAVNRLAREDGPRHGRRRPFYD